MAGRHRRAAQKVAKRQRAGRTISPVSIAGRKIATTFWGEAWCRNLEAYSDYANRLPRGRTHEAMVTVIDELGNSKIVLMALKSKWGTSREDRTFAAYEKYPDRVIPFIGLNGVSPISLDVLEYVDSQLATGKFRGLGELLSRHYGFSVETGAGTSWEAGDFTIALDWPGVQDLM